MADTDKKNSSDRLDERLMPEKIKKRSKILSNLDIGV